MRKEINVTHFLSKFKGEKITQNKTNFLYILKIKKILEINDTTFKNILRD